MTIFEKKKTILQGQKQRNKKLFAANGVIFFLQCFSVFFFFSLVEGKERGNKNDGRGRRRQMKEHIAKCE